MSKKDLKKYLNELTKNQLKDQILDLYERLNEVKAFYNFVFHPKEEKLLEEARFKISKEYFPVNTRKPKIRRSVAQKIIKHFIQLGVDEYIIADVMIFNIEVAQRYTREKDVKQIAFYKSMLKSYKEAVTFTTENNIIKDFMPRLTNINEISRTQNWINCEAFEDSLDPGKKDVCKR